MVNPSDSLPVAVLGGGITGLTAAYRLAARGRRVRLFEAAGRLGGAILSERAGDWLVEAGPNSLQENSPELGRFFRELGLEGAKCRTRPEARHRYILHRGRPCSAPLSPAGLLASRLFSPAARLRILAELLTRPKIRKTDLSLADFGRIHFGREFVDYALSPFVSGVYAGNAEKLSTRHAFPSLWEGERRHGSVIRALLAAARAKRARGEPPGPPPIVSFADGLGELPRALAARLPAGSCELGAKVEGLLPGLSWRLIWSRDGVTRTEEFAAVVLALPAAALARLPVGALGERPLAALEAIDYPPVSSLFLGYRRDQVAHPLDGFGLLVPAAERRSILGAIFSSSLFPGRAPADHVALTVLTGGALNPEPGRLPLDALLPRVRGELAAMLGVRGEPVFVRHHAWPRAIPQYTLGYERHLEAMDRCEQAQPGLFIGGHVRDGIALPACIAAGERLAGRVNQ